ncbi:hypothetical protein H920_05989 [Fukomys damarensis]|uniref:Uncharacterized protein n=1 Tax=Fukomys damarensis TaxID=885580 RepID=A0A091DQ19_FUKDA|nr:hypothetical protein H920_05989 [Fukomys damarensis]
MQHKQKQQVRMWSGRCLQRHLDCERMIPQSQTERLSRETHKMKRYVSENELCHWPSFPGIHSGPSLSLTYCLGKVTSFQQNGQNKKKYSDENIKNEEDIENHDETAQSSQMELRIPPRGGLGKAKSRAPLHLHPNNRCRAATLRAASPGALAAPASSSQQPSRPWARSEQGGLKHHQPTRPARSAGAHPEPELGRIASKVLSESHPTRVLSAHSAFCDGYLSEPSYFAAFIFMHSFPPPNSWWKVFVLIQQNSPGKIWRFLIMNTYPASYSLAANSQNRREGTGAARLKLERPALDKEQTCDGLQLPDLQYALLLCFSSSAGQ